MFHAFTTQISMQHCAIPGRAFLTEVAFLPTLLRPCTSPSTIFFVLRNIHLTIYLILFYIHYYIFFLAKFSVDTVGGCKKTINFNDVGAVLFLSRRGITETERRKRKFQWTRWRKGKYYWWHIEIGRLHFRTTLLSSLDTNNTSLTHSQRQRMRRH